MLLSRVLAAVEPRVTLVGNFAFTQEPAAGKTRETARIVVRRVVEDLERKLAAPAAGCDRESASRNPKPKATAQRN